MLCTTCAKWSIFYLDVDPPCTNWGLALLAQNVEFVSLTSVNGFSDGLLNTPEHSRAQAYYICQDRSWAQEWVDEEENCSRSGGYGKCLRLTNPGQCGQSEARTECGLASGQSKQRAVVSRLCSPSVDFMPACVGLLDPTDFSCAPAVLVRTRG